MKALIGRYEYCVIAHAIGVFLAYGSETPENDDPVTLVKGLLELTEAFETLDFEENIDFTFRQPFLKEMLGAINYAYSLYDIYDDDERDILELLLKELDTEAYDAFIEWKFQDAV